MEPQLLEELSEEKLSIEKIKREDNKHVCSVGFLKSRTTAHLEMPNGCNLAGGGGAHHACGSSTD